MTADAADFRLLMLGAMYENGGNVTHRSLDGHPQLAVYPFESQLGTRHVQDGLGAMFPLKYRWPEFLLDATPAQDFHAIIDEETKVRARTPQVSKFRHVRFDLDDDERKAVYIELVTASGRSRANNIAAFFRATFATWKNWQASGAEQVYVGYSPIVTVDADRILDDLPGAHLLHVVRNPWSAYADTKKRPVPLTIDAYLQGWSTCQHHALLARRRHPERVHIVTAEDVMADAVAALGPVCRALGLEVLDSLATPSWNGESLDQVYPWGTIRSATPEANLATAHELSADEVEHVRAGAWPYLDELGYSDLL